MKDCLTSMSIFLVTYCNTTAYKRMSSSLQKLSFRTVKGNLLQRKRHPFKFEMTMSHNAYSFHQQARLHYDIQPYKRLQLTVPTPVADSANSLFHGSDSPEDYTHANNTITNVGSPHIRACGTIRHTPYGLYPQPRKNKCFYFALNIVFYYLCIR